MSSGREERVVWGYFQGDLQWINVDLLQQQQFIQTAMALWHKLRRIAAAARTKTRNAFRKIMNNRPIVLRSIFAKNTATIFTSLFYKRDKFKPALCKQTEMIAEMHIPRLLRRPIFTAYSKMYKVNLKEVELPLRDYPTFCAFFTRRIKRNFPEAQPNTVCSPCDGKVLVVEEVSGDKCQTIKGCKYSLSQLVTGTTQQDPSFINQNLKISKNTKLFQLVIYLAPGDYHRFHSPTDIDILRRLRIDGRCDSVSQRTLAKGKPIYEKNGRVTVTARWKEGLMTMVMVGALNVMRIGISEKPHLAHGEELGMFNLGSTIIMIIQAKDLREWKVQPGQKIKVGEPLLEYLPA